MEGFTLGESRKKGSRGYFEVAVADYWDRFMPFERQEPVFRAIEAVSGVHHSDSATECDGFAVWVNPGADMPAVRQGVNDSLLSLDV